MLRDIVYKLFYWRLSSVQTHIYCLYFVIELAEFESWDCFILKVTRHKAYSDYWLVDMLQIILSETAQKKH